MAQPYLSAQRHNHAAMTFAVKSVHHHTRHTHITASHTQAEMAHYVSAELNPVMYSWGQYYAAVSPSPPPAASPPPEAYTNICKVSTKHLHGLGSMCPLVLVGFGLAWAGIYNPTNSFESASAIVRCATLHCGLLSRPPATVFQYISI